MTKKEPETVLQPVGKDEMNLAEYPFTLLTRRVSENQKTIEVEQQVRTETGEVVTQSWVVTGSDRYGLPLAIDEDIYIALMKILKDGGFRDRTIPFTRYQILRILGKDISKREYDRIQQSLDRLVGTTITSKNAFWDNRTRSYVSKAFHIFESYELYREQPGRKSARSPELPMSYVVLSSFLFESVKAGYVKNLDIEFYLSLRTPLSKRLFRFLDKKAYNNRSFEIGVMRLAEKLPVHDAFPSQVKRRLEEPHKELIEKGFLAEVSYARRRDGEEKVIYTFKRPRVNAQEPLAPLGDPTVEMLVARGISRSAAEELAARFSEEHIQKHVDAFDQLCAEESPRIRRNPAGYLRRAIEDDYATPEPRRAKPAARPSPGKSGNGKAPQTRAPKRQASERDEAVRDAEEVPLGPRSREGIDPERLVVLREQARQMVLERYPVLAQRSTSPAFDVMVDACLDEILAVEGPTTLTAE